ANIDAIFEIYEARQKEAKEEGIDPVVFAQLVYAMEYEMAYKPVDFFIRRTGALFFDIQWVHAHKDTVISYMAKVLQWTDEQDAEYRKQLEELLYEAVHPEK